jgi:hypothetical protein
VLHPDPLFIQAILHHYNPPDISFLDYVILRYPALTTFFKNKINNFYTRKVSRKYPDAGKSGLFRANKKCDNRLRSQLSHP